MLFPLGPLLLFAPPAVPGRYWPTLFPAEYSGTGILHSEPETQWTAAGRGATSWVLRSKISLRRCIKLLVKSSLPSLPPVPSKAGYLGAPSSPSTIAASIHFLCGPRHFNRRFGIRSDLRRLNCFSASLSLCLYSSEFRTRSLSCVVMPWALVSALISRTTLSAADSSSREARAALIPSRKCLNRSDLESSRGESPGSSGLKKPEPLFQGDTRGVG